MENPISPTMVRKMDTMTIHFVWNLRISLGLSNAEMIVMKEMVMDTYPA